MSTLSLGNLGRQVGETLYEYLERRERELAARVATIRSDLEVLETELAHVRSARRQIGNIPSFGRTPLSLSDLSSPGLSLDDLARDAESQVLVSTEPSNPPTIKDMILKALWIGFRDVGATPAQLRQFIRDAYGRDIDRTSMSPQISRLRTEGLLKQKGGEDNWRLTVRALEQFAADRRYGA
jgi:hypothetical protein